MRDGKFRHISVPSSFSKTNLTSYLIGVLEKLEFEGKIWLLFTKADERHLDLQAQGFFPKTAVRPMVLLNCILGVLREARKESMFATYIFASNPNMPITEAKSRQICLAIEITR